MQGQARTAGGWRYALWGGAAAVLLAPLVAMRYTDEVRWTAADFAFAGVLILGVGLAAEWTVRATRDPACRAGMALALAAALLLVWITAAVGIVGDEGNPFNLLYAAVLATAIGGAALARLRPAGMRRAMLATAGVQALIGAVAVVAGAAEPPGALGLVVLNGGFVALFAASAWLFGRAAGA